MSPKDAPVSGLGDIQRWMLSVLSHPKGVESGLQRAGERSHGISGGVNGVIEDGKELTATERLEIYAEMYFWRLVDILEDDFIALRFAVGPEAFSELATAYLDQTPPTGYSLQGLGRKLPAFLCNYNGHLNLPNRDFLAELAELESCIEKVFDAFSEKPLSADAIQSIPIDRWGDARFSGAASLHLLSTHYPVSTYFLAVEEEGEPAIPEETPSWTALSRPVHTVEQVSLEKEEFLLLQQLLLGHSLWDALGKLADEEDVDPEALIGKIHGWFLRWAEHGFFTGIDLSPAR